MEQSKWMRRALMAGAGLVVIAPGYLGVARNLVSPQVKGWVNNNVNVHRTRFLFLDRSDRTV